MASDPNRDLLPVKEDCCRTGKVNSEKFDHQILGKLSRCELEDRFLRLVDEQTHIKKLANCQEEKIKRLGTKLLRLINEKKHGRNQTCPVQGKESEELHLRVIELEHENYALKDKNIVLKQQLASHSRHLLNHRSPARSNHTSPIMSIRQSAPQVQSEIVFDAAAKNAVADVQLQEAESHIRALNEEIKYLHNKIDYLQQNLERSSLDSRKVKVTENIELIRLQRSLKQQAIQIAALQAQVKNSENSQKKLKEELIRAHKENDEALHLISEKQNEILNLCSKLEEKNLNRLEENELKERINDLMLERDRLKERSEFLMKTIGAKSEESEKVNELKELLAEEKRKKEKLEEALEATRKCIERCPEKSPSSEAPRSERTKPAEEESRSQAKEQVQQPQKKEPVGSTGEISDDSGSTYVKVKCKCNCGPRTNSNPELESDTESSERKTEGESCKVDGKYAAEKMKLERELQYLREMLRSQTCRCEAQQAEICRLMYELKLNEEKCNKTLRRLDMHLTIFEQLEMRSRQVDRSAGEPVRLRNETVAEKPGNFAKAEAFATEQEDFRSREMFKDRSEEKKLEPSSKARRYSSEGSLTSQMVSKEQLSRRTPTSFTMKEDEGRRDFPNEPKKRFVEETFLDLSDDEQSKDENNEKDSFMKKLQELEQSTRERSLERNENRSRFDVNSKHKYRRVSSDSLFSRQDSVQLTNDTSREFKRDNYKTFQGHTSGDRITIWILWLKLDPDGSLWHNESVRLFFIDFSFLDVNGESTETPESLPKPSNPSEKCYFNHSSVIPIHPGRKDMLRSLLNKPDFDLLVFKVVSDSESLNEVNYNCEDVGVANVNVRKFMEQCNKDSFSIQVKNPENLKEVVGTLEVKIECTATVFSF